MAQRKDRGRGYVVFVRFTVRPTSLQTLEVTLLIRRLTLTPGQLAALPEKERALLFLLAHALNEVNVVLKLFLLSTNYDPQPPVVRHAQLCQTMVLSKLLVGKVYETWKALDSGYFGSGLSKAYASQLDAETAAALHRLGKYFGRENVIKSVRQAFSFHYSIAQVRKAPEPDTPADELAIYFGPSVGTSLYQFAEHAVGMAMLDAIDPKDAQAAYDQLFTETQKVASWLNDAGQGILFALLEQHDLLMSRVDELDTITLHSVPMASDVRIPYFFELAQTATAGADK